VARVFAFGCRRVTAQLNRLFRIEGVLLGASMAG